MPQKHHFGTISAKIHTALFSVFALLLCAAANAEGWSYQFEPYVLASSIEGDTSIGRATGVDVDVDMSDILEVLEMAFMGHFEAHHSNGWGVALDYGFMDLSADISGPRGGVVDAKVRQGLFEALLVRRKQSGSVQLDIFAGKHIDPGRGTL